MSLLERMGAGAQRRGFLSTVWSRVPAALALLALCTYGKAENPLPSVGASECSVGVYLLSLSDVSLQDGTCVADFWVWFRWRNAEINPLETIEVIDGTIDSKTGESMKMLKNGFQYACHRVRATLRQKWDVSRFPLDEQRIVIALEDAVLEAGEMILIADQPGSRVSPAVSVPGWSLGSFAVRTQTQAYETNYGDTDLPPGASAEYSRLIVTLDLFRPGMGLFFKLFTGLFVAVGIALVSMAVRPTDLDPRFGLPVGAMFASIASQYVIASVLPATSEFTLADQLHVLAVGVIFLVLLESVVSLFLTYADHSCIARRLDAACLAILLVTTTAAVVILVGNARVPATETLAALNDHSQAGGGDSVRVKRAEWRVKYGRSSNRILTLKSKYRSHESDAQLGMGNQLGSAKPDALPVVLIWSLEGINSPKIPASLILKGHYPTHRWVSETYFLAPHGCSFGWKRIPPASSKFLPIVTG
jgi:hypothetical protein